MILNETQISLVKSYLTHISKGKSKSEAADLVGVARSTLRRWLDAENVPTVDKPKKEYKEGKAVEKVADKPASKEVESKVDDTLVPFQAIVLPKTIMIVRDGVPVQIDKTHQNFAKISEVIAERKVGETIPASALEEIHNMIDLKQAIKKQIQAFKLEGVEVSEMGVQVDGKPLRSKLADLLLKALKNGDEADLTRFIKFHRLIDEAISFRVTTRLLDFVSRSGLNISDDGKILAVKVVRNDFKDKHSGTFDNSPGKIVEVKRNQVDDDEDRTCSNGLHVAAPAYIGHFGSRSGGDRVILVEVDPRDFVAIPKDYQATKARVCKYVVLKEISDKAELDKIWESSKTITSKG